MELFRRLLLVCCIALITQSAYAHTDTDPDTDSGHDTSDTDPDTDSGVDTDSDSDSDTDSGHDTGGHDHPNGDNERVTICHIPPGNPDNAHTITISVNAWPAHERHNDTAAACSITAPVTNTGTTAVFTICSNQGNQGGRSVSVAPVGRVGTTAANCN